MLVFFQILDLQIPTRIARDYNTLEGVELGQTVIYQRSSKFRTVAKIFCSILISKKVTIRLLNVNS